MGSGRRLRSVSLKVAILVFLLALFHVFVILPWTREFWLTIAKNNFEVRSHAVEEKILKETGLFVSSRAFYIDTGRFTYDLKRGLVRRFPVDEINLFIYFPPAKWRSILLEGQNDPHQSTTYKNLRTQIIRYFDDEFTDPWVVKNLPKISKIIYKVETGPENKTREELLKDFRPIGRGA